MIIATNVSKQFGKLKALENLSVTCNKGECIALIGPNGSGKTTFIKAILGMVICNSGFITFNGMNIKNNWQYRSQVGYMPQIGRYPDNMSIGLGYSVNVWNSLYLEPNYSMQTEKDANGDREGTFNLGLGYRF